MSSIDITQLPELVSARGRKFMFESYESIPAVYPLITKIVSPADAESPFYGDRGSVGQGLERFRRTMDGQDAPASTLHTAYNWQAAIHPYKRSLEISDRMLEAANASAKVGSLIQKWASDFGLTAILTKEEHVADMFQQGTLTAGNSVYFNQSYTNNTDSNPTVIYDGLPWFDTAHLLGNGHIAGSTNYANHVVSSALTETTLGTQLDLMQISNAVNDRGQRIMNRMDTLLVPAGSQGRVAKKILDSEKEPGSANNAINPLQSSLSLIEWDFLDDSASASSWWLLNRAQGSGVSVYDSGAPVIRLARDERKGLTLLIAEYRFGAAVTDWRFAGAFNKAAS